MGGVAAGHRPPAEARRTCRSPVVVPGAAHVRVGGARRRLVGGWRRPGASARQGLVVVQPARGPNTACRAASCATCSSSADGTAWIGTYGGGVGRLRDGRVSRVGMAQGLPDNSVSRILDDGRGRLWISTNRGVAVCDKSQLHDVADGRRSVFEPVVFGLERGVGEANFGSPAGFADAKGVLWFGTIDGAVRIDSTAFPFNATPPAVSIDAIVGRRPAAVGRARVVDVPALTARVRLELAASGLLYPELTRFRFRVEGVDPDWVDMGPQRTLIWTPPGPGRYRLAFDARNEDGIWSTAPAVVDLDVRPAWWQTRTVRVLGALGGAAGRVSRIPVAGARPRASPRRRVAAARGTARGRRTNHQPARATRARVARRAGRRAGSQPGARGPAADRGDGQQRRGWTPSPREVPATPRGHRGHLQGHRRRRHAGVGDRARHAELPPAARRGIRRPSTCRTWCARCCRWFGAS